MDIISKSILTGSPALCYAKFRYADNTLVSSSDVESVALTVYKQATTILGAIENTPVTGFNELSISPEDCFVDETTSPGGRTINFDYCIEGAFADPNTQYLARYKFTMADGHTKIILYRIRTEDY